MKWHIWTAPVNTGHPGAPWQHCRGDWVVCLLECTNQQLAFKVPSAKSAFPQRKRGPEGVEGTYHFGRHSCLLQTLARHLTAAWPQFPQHTEREQGLLPRLHVGSEAAPSPRTAGTMWRTAYKGITDPVFHNTCQPPHLLFVMYMWVYTFMYFHYDRYMWLVYPNRNTYGYMPLCIVCKLVMFLLFDLQIFTERHLFFSFLDFNPRI